jgi:alkylation response protein AidB-like acyl-CoA dehydrogenase
MNQMATLPSDEERELLRNAVRSLLEECCPLDSMEAAVERAGRAAYAGELNQRFVELGLVLLGTNPSEGGLREVLLVAEEIGRRGASVPICGAILANWLLYGQGDDATHLLSEIHQGATIAAFHFGQFDIDASAGKVKLTGETVSGCLRHTEDAQVASHLLFPVEGRWACADLNHDSVIVTPLPGLAHPALTEIHLKHTPVTLFESTGMSEENLLRLSKLFLAARALGAASRGFELVVEYAKERQQFGQPIGRFQAVQHKLADNMIRLESSRLLLVQAAEAFDLGNPDWVVSADAAHAFISTVLRQASLETHHVFGAIGYSEEHEAPHQFKRIHADLVRFGGTAASREALAQYLLDAGNDMPDYDLGEDGNRFRQETREWLASHWPPSSPEAFSQAAREYKLLQVTWPEKFGGRGASPMEQLAFLEECERAGVTHEDFLPCEIQAQALMLFGSPQQQQAFLPRIAAGELKICLGYSEPGSGSDLASLKTTAVLDGDEWVINGTKIWTTMAEEADYMWLAARTDPDAEKPHAGISVFLVPMDTPGITIQPSMALYGKTFCQEFLDDVRVPQDALVGQVNGGWYVILAALATERVIMGGFVSMVREKFRYLVEAVRQDQNGLASNGWVRNKIGELAADIEASRQLVMNATRITQSGGIPIHEASMSGVYNSELMERLGEAALDILGNAATLHSSAPGSIPGELEQMLRQSIMMVIGGGTNEIQRNLIAQKGLGLPR